MVSTVNLTKRTTNNMPNTPAVADPKVINPPQIRCAVDSAILLSDASSSKLYMDMVSSGMTWPVIPRAMVLSKAGFSAGNII
ncbi:hypothetical protein DMN91_000600 [Ooceraea biroi]|uniref:Uncharacterized protein n=1 Tax=Ooceraea biroi TaxID=2015173 RepID=A0A3L8E2X3_OOCBI|nr:hypothetical protein DMN91_000600 [Ooceraea biroi]